MIDWLTLRSTDITAGGGRNSFGYKMATGEQYIFVSTSFVFVHGWRSGLQAKTLVRIAQRVGSIQMGFCCILLFFLLFVIFSSFDFSELRFRQCSRKRFFVLFRAFVFSLED